MTWKHRPATELTPEQVLAAWGGHVAVITYGEDHFEPYADDDGQEHYEIEVECTRPDRCEGWVTCTDGEHPEHAGIGSDELVLHGVAHTWRGHDLSWCVDAPHCVVNMSRDWTDSVGECAYDIGRQHGPGRYRVVVDWDDFGPVLQTISDDPDLFQVDPEGADRRLGD